MSTLLSTPPPMEMDRWTEKAFRRRLAAEAEARGWLCVHVPPLIGNPEGVAQLILFRNDAYRLFELKTVKGVVSGVQHHWHAEAAASGVPVHVLRPTPVNWERAMDLLA